MSYKPIKGLTLNSRGRVTWGIPGTGLSFRSDSTQKDKIYQSSDYDINSVGSFLLIPGISKIKPLGCLGEIIFTIFLADALLESHKGGTVGTWLKILLAILIGWILYCTYFTIIELVKKKRANNIDLNPISSFLLVPLVSKIKPLGCLIVLLFTPFFDNVSQIHIGGIWLKILLCILIVWIPYCTYFAVVEFIKKKRKGRM